MRAIAVAAILALSTVPVALFAQQNEQTGAAQTGPATSQPQTVPVQPDQTPQQSEQAKKDERERSQDVQIGQGWKGEQGGRMGMGKGTMGMGNMSNSDMARMMQQMRMCHEMMERMRGRDHGDDDNHADRTYRDDRSYRNEYRRGDRRVKICIEDDDGEEYCRYRR